MKIPPLNQIKDGDFEPLPIGKYHVEIVEAKEDHSDSDKPKFKVKFEVVDGEYSGRFIFKDFILTEKALWAIKPFLLVFGVKQDVELNIDVKDFVGQQLIVNNGHRLYEGKTYNDPKSYTSLQEAKVEKVTRIPF